MSILPTATIILAFYSLFTTALTAIGKTTQILKINAVSVISAVAMLLTLVSFFETTGAAITRLTTQITCMPTAA